MKFEATDISVIVPVYNEESLISEIYERLVVVLNKMQLRYKIIFVNDGSKDNSATKIYELSAKDAHVLFINFSRNFGHQVAVMAGIDYCRSACAVIIDSDLQDPPELIEQLYAKYKEGFKVVYAKRIQRKGETWFKKITAKWFYRLMSRITNIDIPLDAGDFRLIDKKIIDKLKEMPEKQKFLRGQIAWLGFSQTYISYEREERLHGKTGYSFIKMLRLAVDAITSFSNFPLRLATIAGFIVSFIAFLIILYALYSKFILHRVITGWTSLIISSMFIGGIQLLTIGIIGEYISRINVAVKNRPLYIIEDTNIEEEE